MEVQWREKVFAPFLIRNNNIELDVCFCDDVGPDVKQNYSHRPYWKVKKGLVVMKVWGCKCTLCCKNTEILVCSLVHCV